MKEKIRVVQYGLGPIGSAIACLISKRAELELVGGVDIDTSKIGNDVDSYTPPCQPSRPERQAEFG